MALSKFVAVISHNVEIPSKNIHSTYDPFDHFIKLSPNKTPQLKNVVSVIPISLKTLLYNHILSSRVE